MKRKFFRFFVILSLLFLGCAGLRPKPVFVSKKASSGNKTVQASRSKPVQQAPETVASGHSGKNSTPAPHEKSKMPPKDKSARVSLQFRQKMMRAVEDYLGTPYKWGGEGYDGIDCSGFVMLVYRRADGLEMPHSVAKQARLGKPVPKGDLEFGDLLFFRKPGNGQIYHVGIYLGNGNFTHASTGNGVTISKLSERYYRDRFAFARRVK